MYDYTGGVSLIALAESIYGLNGCKSLVFMFLDLMGIGDVFGITLLNPTWWYMSAMQVSILFLAISYVLLEKRIGILWILMVLWIGHYDQSNLYMCCVLSCMTGACIYEYKIIDRIHKVTNLINEKMSALIVLVVCICGFIMWNCIKDLFYIHYVSAIFLPIICFLATHYVLNKIMIIKDILNYIGQKSGMLFMLHTFVYSIIEVSAEWVYSFKYAAVTYILVVLITIVISNTILWIEKKIHYFDFVNRIKE